MYCTNELIEFMFYDIKFTLSDYKHQTIVTPYPLHYHSKDSIEIHYIKYGKGTAIINENIYEVEKGYFYVTGALVTHGQIPAENEAIEKYSLYFYFDTSKCKNENILKIVRTPVFIDKTKTNIEPYLELIEEEFKTKNFGYKEMIIQAIKALMLNIIRNYSLHLSSFGNKKIKNNLFEIEQIISKECSTISLSELAKRLYMSERDLQRYLAKNFNKNFNTLKLEARMFNAVNQLLYTDKSILEIAESLGYSSCEHFSYAFKKYYGIPPLKYRSTNQINIGKPVHLNLTITK